MSQISCDEHNGETRFCHLQGAETQTSSECETHPLKYQQQVAVASRKAVTPQNIEELVKSLNGCKRFYAECWSWTTFKESSRKAQNSSSNRKQKFSKTIRIWNLVLATVCDLYHCEPKAIHRDFSVLVKKKSHGCNSSSKLKSTCGQYNWTQV